MTVDTNAVPVVEEGSPFEVGEDRTKKIHLIQEGVGVVDEEALTIPIEIEEALIVDVEVRMTRTGIGENLIVGEDRTKIKTGEESGRVFKRPPTKNSPGTAAEDFKIEEVHLEVVDEEDLIETLKILIRIIETILLVEVQLTLW